MADTSHLLSQFYVKLEGADAPEELMHDLLEVTVESSLHLPDVATLVLNDSRLRWVDDARLEPGKALLVSAKAGGREGEKPLFDGEIVEIEPELGSGAQRLVVRAFDRLHRLGRGCYVRSFLNVTDGDLVQRIAQEAGLQARVGPAGQVHPYVLQANETNMELLQARAAALGYLLFVQGKTLHCVPPEPQGTPVELRWGQTLQEFRPRMTTVGQVTRVTARGWDPGRRQEIVGQAGNGKGAPKVGETRGGGELVQGAFHLEAPHLVADRPIRTQAAADQLAQAAADSRAGRFIEAEGTCAGNPAVVAGASVRLDGVGTRFGGVYFVTGATHLYSASRGYTTHFSISGHHASTLLGLLKPEQETASPAGLVIGIVTDNQDPEGQGRVKVKFPWLSGEHASDWARVVVPGGGADRGIQFLPEVNDEVLVGFELGDIHYPYVLGGLWNGQDAPPRKSGQAVSSGRVQQRVIRSRTGHTITLDDTDGGGGITIEDKNGNKVVLDTGKNALTIEVKGDASVKAHGSLTFEAQGQVEIKGMGVKIDGGAGTVDVTGSLINLN
jgi:type VI secretion system (T6SS) baseplate-like injector VgrG